MQARERLAYLRLDFFIYFILFLYIIIINLPLHHFPFHGESPSRRPLILIHSHIFKWMLEAHPVNGLRIQGVEGMMAPWGCLGMELQGNGTRRWKKLPWTSNEKIPRNDEAMPLSTLRTKKKNPEAIFFFLEKFFLSPPFSLRKISIWCERLILACFWHHNDDEASASKPFLAWWIAWESSQDPQPRFSLSSHQIQFLCSSLVKFIRAPRKLGRQ